ncbi:MAG TPA: hypothetical protein HA263_05125 [Methanoregulaceae archaeon]|nr:hypothetical protein [Methanoregulaceae archaeon]
MARRTIIRAKRDLEDPSLFHRIVLIPVLAWIGLGADGVSSSAHGPAGAFVALGDHSYLAVFLALGNAGILAVTVREEIGEGAG